eukprot:c29091_g1_i6 orf=1072-6219(-)
MKVPLAAQEGLNCRTSEVLLRQRLGDLYLQFIGTDRTSKTGGHEGECAASRAGNLWHCETSEISASSTQDVMVSQSDMEGSSKKSSAALRSAEFPVVLDVDSATDRLQGIARKDQAEKGEASSCRRLSEDFYSGEVNPETYDVAVAASRRWNGRGGIESSSSACAFSAIVKQSDDLDLSSPQRAQAEGGLGFPNDGEPKQLFEFGPDAFSQSGSHVRDLPRMNAAAAAHRVPSQRPRVKLMCSFAGSILPRPYDGKLRYVGGETRIIGVNRDIRYTELMYKLTEFYGVALTLKYQLPDEDLDALISVSSDDDLQNMMEEYDKLELGGGYSRLRLFLFSAVENDIQSPLNDDGDHNVNSDLQYIDALNGIPVKGIRSPSEPFLNSGTQQLGESVGLDVSVTRSSRTLGASPVGVRNSADMQSVPHRPTVWFVPSAQTISAPLTAPSSPSVPSRKAHLLQQHAVPDWCIGSFQDQQKHVSVQRYGGTCSEVCFQDFDQVVPACQLDHRHYFTDSQRGCTSPRLVPLGIVLPTCEHLPAEDAIGQNGSQVRLTKALEQRLEHGMVNGNGLVDQWSDNQQFSELPRAHYLVVQQQQRCQLQQQHHCAPPQQFMPPQQQYTWQVPVDTCGDLQRFEKVHHYSKDVSSELESLQYPSVHTSYFHPRCTASGRNRVPKQGEHPSIHQDAALGGMLMRRSVSLQTMGMALQFPHGQSSASAYHMASAPSSPRIVVQDFHTKQHLHAQKGVSGSQNEKAYCNQLYYGDQSSRSYQVSACPFGGNMACTDEYTVPHQQLSAPLVSPKGGLQDQTGIYFHRVHGTVPTSQCQFSDSLPTPLSPRHTGLNASADVFLPLHGESKGGLQAAYHEKDSDTFIQQQQFLLPLVSSSLRKQALEHTSFYPELHTQTRDLVDFSLNSEVNEAKLLHSCSGHKWQPAYTDKDFSREVESGKYLKRSYYACHHCGQGDFDRSMLLAAGDTCSASHFSNDLHDSFVAMPMALHKSHKYFDGANVSGNLMPEAFHVDQPTLSLSEPDQLSKWATTISAAVANDLVRTSVGQEAMESYLPLTASQESTGLCSSGQERSSEFCFYNTDISLCSHVHGIQNEPSILYSDVNTVNLLVETCNLKQPSLYLNSNVEILPEHKGSSQFGFHKTDSPLSNLVTDAMEGPANLLAAVDLLNLPSGSHSLEVSSMAVDSYSQNFNCNCIDTSESFTDIGKRASIPGKKVLDETISEFSPSLLEFKCTQPTREGTIVEKEFPYVVSQDGFPTVSYCAGFPMSKMSVVSCQPSQVVSPQNSIHGVYVAAVNDSEQEPFNLPIYDRSPVGSMNAETPRDVFLNPVESIRLSPISLESTLMAGQHSVTGGIAEDMICSVLESHGNQAYCEEKPCNTEVTHEEAIDLGGIGRREGEVQYVLENIEKCVALPTFKDRQKSVIQGADICEEIEDAKETSKAALEGQSGACEEDFQEGGGDGAGKIHIQVVSCTAYTEAEAKARKCGLQIIKNADLEEVRELGSGTYGTVYHGKWRGSDVAIKRLKSSCFTGSSSQQERLISDFWREASTLSQLHHPNVVAFYGVVPDGPDRTLGTVTEYMVNGSLKQVLQKKDRTIDRRKRLLIAMDAAFGMEYLHGKNIVHFDLKCENLLVNMRDPHRPICKVGDFGLSKVKHHTLVSGGVRGTLPWMAPELLNGNNSMVTEKVREPFGFRYCAILYGHILFSGFWSGQIF